MVNLSIHPEYGFDRDMYAALHTSMTVEDAVNALEIGEVHRSWLAAGKRNDERIGAIIARRRERADGH